jgi:transcriptional regulator with XRE-family HTH domain
MVAGVADRRGDAKADEEAFERLSAYEALELGPLIRRARESSRLSLRELARRAGVSAGQLSRIENGQVLQPAQDTLEPLARALNRDPRPLEFLADRMSFDDLCDGIDAMFDEMYERGETSPLEDATSGARWAIKEAQPDDREDQRWEAGASLAHVWFEHRVYGNVSADVLSTAEDPDLRAVAEAWPGLTDQRKRLVRLLVADQVFVSERERRDGTSRAQIEIEFPSEETRIR